MVAQEYNLTETKSSVNGTDDREARPKFWIAAYTRPHSEKKAALELAKNLQIETYVPLQTVTRQWSDRKKKIEMVVIPMIVFAKVSNDEEILEVKKHPLIIKVLTLPGHKKAAKIPNVQIENLKFLLLHSSSPVQFSHTQYSKNDNIRVIKGQLKGLIGKVDKISDTKSKLTVLIDILGGVTVEINSKDIEPFKD